MTTKAGTEFRFEGPRSNSEAVTGSLGGVTQKEAQEKKGATSGCR